MNAKASSYDRGKLLRVGKVACLIAALAGTLGTVWAIEMGEVLALVATFHIVFATVILFGWLATVLCLTKDSPTNPAMQVTQPEPSVATPSVEVASLAAATKPSEAGKTVYEAVPVA